MPCKKRFAFSNWSHVEEWSMTSTFIFCQYVNLRCEFVMALYRAWLTQTLSSFDLCSLNTTKQSTDVITSLSVIKQLAEHLDTSYNMLVMPMERIPYGILPQRVLLPVSMAKVEQEVRKEHPFPGSVSYKTSPKTGAALPALPFVAVFAAAGIVVCGRKARKN